MAENAESATEKDYPNLCEMLIDAVVWRMAHDAEFFRFSGLIRDHQEKLAVRYQKACRDGG